MREWKLQKAIIAMVGLAFIGCGDGQGSDFGDGELSPTDVPTATEFDPSTYCAPVISIDEDSIGLYYDASFKAYVSLPLGYELTCGQAVGGRVEVDVSFESGNDDIAFTTHLFLTGSNEHAYVDLNLAKIVAHVDIEQDPGSQWTLVTRLVDSEGYSSNEVEVQVVPTELEEADETTE